MTTSAHLVCYKQPPLFRDTNIPRFLLVPHRSLKGVWTEFNVMQGGVECMVFGNSNTFDTISIVPNSSYMMVPQVLHYVGQIGPETSFYIRFYKEPTHD